MSDTTALIIGAAAALLNNRGQDDVTIRNVAEAASVGRSTVVHHFESKEGLLDALYLTALEAFSVYVRDANFGPGYTVASEQYSEDLRSQLDLVADENRQRQSPIAMYAGFRSECPGFWALLRSRKCPEFTEVDAPVSWGLVHGLADGDLEAPAGPTVDLVIHQLLTLQDWLAVAKPDAVIRAMHEMPSVPYWATVFGTDG